MYYVFCCLERKRDERGIEGKMISIRILGLVNMLKISFLLMFDHKSLFR